MNPAQQVSADHIGPRAVCTCGHVGDGTDSQHVHEGAPGHGRCKVPGCDCQQFTWKAWTRAFLAKLSKVRPS